MRRHLITATLALVLAGLPAACGEEDVKEVDRQTRDEAGEVKRDVEKKGREAEKDVDKEIKD